MTAPYLCRCPACQTPLKLKDDSLIGKRIKCPKCAGVVVVPGPDGAVNPAPRAAAAPPPAAVPPAAKTSPQAPAPVASPGPVPSPASPITPSVPLARPVASPGTVSNAPTAPAARSRPEPDSIQDELEEQPQSMPLGGGEDEADEEQSERQVKRPKVKARGGFGVIHVIAILLIAIFIGLAIAVQTNVIGVKPLKVLRPSVATNQINTGLPHNNPQQPDTGIPDKNKPNKPDKPDKTKTDPNVPDKNPLDKNPVDKTNTGVRLTYPPLTGAEGQKALRLRAELLAKEDASFKTLAEKVDRDNSRDIEIATLYLDGNATAIAISPGGAWLAAGDAAGNISLMDLAKGEYSDNLRKHKGKITGLAFAPDGRSLASCSEDHTVQLWNLMDMPQQKAGKSIELAAETEPHCLAFSPDGTLLALGSADTKGRSVTLWKLPACEPAAKLPKIDSPVDSLAFRSDGKVLAVLQGNDSVAFFNPKTGHTYDKIESTKGATHVEFRADGSLLASATRDALGKTIVTHPGSHKGMERTLAVTFLNDSGDKTLSEATILLPSMSGPKSARFSSRFGQADVSTLCFSPGGQFLAVAGGNAVMMWYVPDLQNDAILETIAVLGNNGNLRRAPTGLALDFGDNLTDADLLKLPREPLISHINVLGNDKITNAGLSNLKKFPNLRFLYLNGVSKVDDAGLVVLTTLTRLEVLNLSGNQTLTDGAAVHIGQLPELKELYLARTRMTGAAMDKLRSLRNLTQLDLSGCAIVDPGDLKMLTSLVHLSLVDCSMTDAGMAQLASLSSLESLSLIGNPKVTDLGCKSLKGLTGLKNLFLAGTSVGDQGLADLKDLKMLQNLGIDGTKVTDAGFEHLAGLTALYNLNLGRLDGLTGSGLKYLAPLPNLNHLGLGETKVTDQGMVGLKDLKQLRSIQLPPGVSDMGLEPLANLPNLISVGIGMMPNLKGPGLKHLPKATGLDLSLTGVTDAGLAGVKDLKALTYLNLPTVITDAGLAHLQNLQELNSLQLRGTQVTDAGIKTLAGMKKLQYLDVRDTKVTAKGIEELKKALPALNVQKEP